MRKKQYSAYRVLFSKKSATVAVLSPNKANLARIHRIKAICFFDNRIKHLKKRTDKKNGFFSLWKFATQEEKKLFVVTLAKNRQHRVQLHRPASRAKGKFEDKSALTPAQKRKPVWKRFQSYRYVCRSRTTKRLEKAKQQREALKRRAQMIKTEQKARELARFELIKDLI